MLKGKIYRIDFTGNAEHNISDMWCIDGKTSVPDNHKLTIPFKNGGGHGAIYLDLPEDDRLSDLFLTAVVLITNSFGDNENKSEEKIFKIWHSHKDTYWIAVFPEELIKIKDINIGKVYMTVYNGYEICIKEFNRIRAFSKAIKILNKYPVEHVII